MEILGFSDHKTTAAVWYRLLNLGFRIPAAGGTDAMANFASLRGPVGMNRVYVRVPDGEVKVPDWLQGLKQGRSFATNGPLLGLRLGGATVGDELKFAGAQPRVSFSVHLRSIVPVDQLDLVCNGRVMRSFVKRAPIDHGDFEGTIPVSGSGWCVLRASTEAAREEVLDNYVYATTSPIYVTIGGAAPHSPQDAKYFAAWIDRLSEARDELSRLEQRGRKARRSRSAGAGQGAVRDDAVAASRSPRCESIRPCASGRTHR